MQDSILDKSKVSDIFGMSEAHVSYFGALTMHLVLSDASLETSLDMVLNNMGRIQRFIEALDKIKRIAPSYYKNTSKEMYKLLEMHTLASNASFLANTMPEIRSNEEFEDFKKMIKNHLVKAKAEIGL